MSFIWATRGRRWGFRFLRSGGHADPLIEYERVFSAVNNEPEVFQRVGQVVALRFLDPLGRHDHSGRPIPHEFVLGADLAPDVSSVEDGLRLIWPRVAQEYAEVWDLEKPPGS